MKIQLGKPVFSTDGEQVGSVDRLVFNAETKALDELIVHKGLLLREDRIIEQPQIDRVDEDGSVWLRLSAAEIDRLPIFFEQQYTVVHEGNPIPGEESEPGWSAYPMPGNSYARTLWSTKPVGRDYARIDSSAEFEPAPFQPQQVEIVSNIALSEIKVGKGTDIVASDGKKLGHIEEVEVDQDGAILGLVAKVGIVTHRYLRVPVEAVASIGEKAVRLAVTADALDRMEEVTKPDDSLPTLTD